MVRMEAKSTDLSVIWRSAGDSVVVRMEAKSTDLSVIGDPPETLLWVRMEAQVYRLISDW